MWEWAEYWYVACIIQASQVMDREFLLVLIATSYSVCHDKMPGEFCRPTLYVFMSLLLYMYAVSFR